MCVRKCEKFARRLLRSESAQSVTLCLTSALAAAPWLGAVDVEHRGDDAGAFGIERRAGLLAGERREYRRQCIPSRVGRPALPLSQRGGLHACDDDPHRALLISESLDSGPAAPKRLRRPDEVRIVG